MSGDITLYWYCIAEILNGNSFVLNSVNFWGHNDVNMLEVGNGNLTIAEHIRYMRGLNSQWNV